MFQSTRWLWAALLIGGAMLFAGAVDGQETKPLQIIIRGESKRTGDLAAVSMEMHSAIDPVAVGKNAVYRVTLTNTGSAPLKKLNVKATVPALLEAVRATGPTKETVADKVITFATVEMLQPGAKAVFAFECKALKTGAARFRVEYTSDLNYQAVYEELVTRLVAPQAPASALPQGDGQDKKHDTAALSAALRDVINAGAKIYNDNGDHAGCFRIYQGSLLSVRPFVAPDLQKKIDASLASSDKLGSYADRAHELRKVLNEIRERTKGPAETKDPPESKEKGQVSGKVTFDGEPIVGNHSVTIVSASDKKFTTAVQKDGTFQFREMIPIGEYRVAIEPSPKTKESAVPARYTSETTSGLTLRVQPGKQDIDLNLVK